MAVPDSSDLARRVAEHPAWYHTIDLAPGVTTAGFCDLRPFAPAALPASLAGRRCLDVGTFDGFWAFEMERRGATVHALDLEDGRDADWPPNTRAANEAASAEVGLEWGSGFRLAHEALGSSVQRVLGNVYDLTPEQLGGQVDFVLSGTILQHLRDPVGALERMHDALVPGGDLLMIEAYHVGLTRRHPRRPVGEYRPAVPGSLFTWWMPNLSALRAWAITAGFEAVERQVPLHRPLRGAGRGDHVAALAFVKPR
jgi:tRNA (mo5U34)-methyltransferase